MQVGDELNCFLYFLDVHENAKDHKTEKKDPNNKHKTNIRAYIRI
jgi:hypothetical protein